MKLTPFLTLAIIAVLLAIILPSLNAIHRPPQGLMGGWTAQDAENPELLELWNDRAQNLFLGQLTQTEPSNVKPAVKAIATQVVAGLNIMYTVVYGSKTYDIAVFRNLSDEVSISKIQVRN